jgi:hypothetical protein
LSIFSDRVYHLGSAYFRHRRLQSQVGHGDGHRGAFLNADIASTCIKVHMRLHRVLTDMLDQFDPKHARFVEDRGTPIVFLDKALYGCIETTVL